VNIVFEICSMPRDLHIYYNKSMVQLLKESGYFGHEDSVTKEEVMKVLRAYPNFIKDWVDYSDDKRASSGWYLQHLDAEKWVLGYYSGIRSEKEQVFTSGYEACAAFILMEVASIAQSLS
jgi:hypothetical protein